MFRAKTTGLSFPGRRYDRGGRSLGIFAAAIAIALAAIRDGAGVDAANPTIKDNENIAKPCTGGLGAVLRSQWRGLAPQTPRKIARSQSGFINILVFLTTTRNCNNIIVRDRTISPLKKPTRLPHNYQKH
ncbi:MAG: hypothetical protein J7647_24375 [Cyanobacteria bacterium SBLK]|nr:hypothetical protein [Cyanobacteria bacterium SBLK]